VEPTNSGDEDLFEEAHRFQALGRDLLDGNDPKGAADALTRALILFLELECKEETVAIERLLTRIVPRIGPFVYRDIRKAIEIELGVRDPDPPKN
jgi:hypothetical protein